MLAGLPKRCSKMLFEGNEACLWHTEAGGSAMAKLRVPQMGFFFAYISL